MASTARVIHPKDRRERSLIEGSRATFTHAETMTLAEWHFEAGVALPEHAHPHEQATTLIEGQFELTVSGEARVLDSGTIAVIPSNAPHSGRALTDCRLIDVFHPVREDYL